MSAINSMYIIRYSDIYGSSSTFSHSKQQNTKTDETSAKLDADKVSISREASAILDATSNSSNNAVAKLKDYVQTDVLTSTENTTSNELPLFTSTKTFASGTSVRIDALAENYALDDPRYNSKPITATITKADGTTSTMQINDNTVFSEDENGNLIISTLDKAHANDANRTNSDRDELYVIKHMWGDISTGDGDDTIMLLGSTNVYGIRGYDETLHLGDGNNTVIANHTKNVNISAGDGNNTISNIEGTIELGDGNNAITNSSLYKLTVGDGDNTISNIDGSDGSVELGNGNNTITNSSLYSLVAGDGDNNFTLDFVQRLFLGDGNNTANIKGMSNDRTMGEAYRAVKNAEYSPSSISGGVSINLGNGDNDINIETILTNGVSINGGDGNNSLDIENFFSLVGANITFGEGDNELIVENYNAIPENYDTEYDQYGIITKYHQTQRSDITMGNGDNKILLKNVGTESILEDKNGEPLPPSEKRYSTGMMDITLGNGNNLIQSDEYNTISTIFEIGNGNNRVAIEDFYSGLYARMDFGHGNNSVEFEKFRAGFTMFRFGNGDNTFKVEDFESPFAWLEFGTGKNLIVAEHFKAVYANFTFAGGNNSIEITDFKAVLANIEFGGDNNEVNIKNADVEEFHGNASSDKNTINIGNEKEINDKYKFNYKPEDKTKPLFIFDEKFYALAENF